MLNLKGSLEKVLNYYRIPCYNYRFKIVCPFHADTDASLMVDLDSDSWFCFGCQKSGNAYEFVLGMEKGKLNELESYQLLVKILGSSSLKTKDKRKIRRRKKKSIQESILEAKDYYYNLSRTDWLRNSSEIKKYMNKRGFKNKTLNRVNAKLNYNDHYPIIFPLLDLQEFKGWVCRTDKADVEKKRKYLYNEGFSRANTIVGNYSSRVVFLVEGYLDLVKSVQLGVEKIGAILGWKITNEQIEKLKKQGVKIIVDALDNDEKGKEGGIILRQHFKVIRFKYPSYCKDMGEISKNDFLISKRQILKKLKRGV